MPLRWSGTQTGSSIVAISPVPRTRTSACEHIETYRPRAWCASVPLEKSGRLADAEASYREAAARAPDHAEIYSNIGSVCVLQQHFADADQPLMRALELDPSDAYSLAMLAHARQQCCAWDGIDPLLGALRRMLENPSELRRPIVPFPLLAMPLFPRHLLVAARRWSRSLAPSPAMSRPPWHARPGERLRVGFVSSDFRPHPLVVVLAELWERLDRNRVETFAYGLLPENNTEVGSRVKRAFEHFRRCKPQPQRCDPATHPR
jgi:protein O-GlcNAc transferase